MLLRIVIAHVRCELNKHILLPPVSFASTPGCALWSLVINRDGF